MRQPIFTKRGKLLLITIGTIAFSISALIISVGIRDYMAQEDEIRELRYSELVTHQLLSKWQCVPDSLNKRREFILSLMKRFAPDDFKQVEPSRAWINDYKSKQLAGTFTVEERAKLNAAYEKGILPWRTDISESDQWMSKISLHGHSAFGVSKCAISPFDTCQQEAAFSVDKDTGGVIIIYNDSYIQWSVTAPPDLLNTKREPNRLYRGEYDMLKNSSQLDARIEALQQQMEHDEALLKEARQRVLKMTANGIAAGGEEQATMHDYLKHKCSF